jgi:hypothetical protein
MRFGPKVNPVGARAPFPKGEEPAIQVLPTKPVVYPEATKAAVFGGMIGRSPLTPAPILRESAASDAVGRKRFAFGVWTEVTVDRPTVLWALLNNQETEGPVLLYNYGKIPENDESAQLAERCGICYLSQPGTWWVLNKTAAGQPGFTFEALIIDATAPETAARFQRQAGVNRVRQLNYVIDDETVAVLVAAPNRYRRAITVQNVPDSTGASADLRVCVIGLDTYLIAAGVWTGQGILLAAGGSLTLEQQALSNDGIYVCLEAAGATACEVVDYFDDEP